MIFSIRIIPSFIIESNCYYIFFLENFVCMRHEREKEVKTYNKYVQTFMYKATDQRMRDNRIEINGLKQKKNCVYI